MLTHFAKMLDEDDVTLFLHGACHVFVLALHQRFGYPMFLLRDLGTLDQKSAAHVYCRFSDSASVDVAGIAPENLALAELGWSGQTYRRMQTSPKELQSFFT